jgi:hypothetical protein
VPTPYLQALPDSPSLTHAFAKSGRHHPSHSGLNRSLRPDGLFSVDKPARVPRLDTGAPFLVSFLDFLGPFFRIWVPFLD